MMKHKLHYPDALEWMWSYCTYVGSFTSSEGEHYDLGFHVDESFTGSDNNFRFTQAIVHDNKPGSYISGRIHDNFEVSAELKRRMILFKILPT